jgi:antitoxin component YwqK of YwqJK toxin-antitoxin module
MKNSLLILLLILCSYCFSQDTLYYDEDWNFTRNKELAETYRTKTQLDKNLFKVQEYNSKHQLLMSGYYLFKKKLELKHGKFEYFYINGNLKSSENYIEGNKNGEFLSYYENSKMSSKKYFNNNEIDSISESYYESGNIKSSFFYVKGKSVGKHTKYLENGKIESTTEYFSSSEEQIEKEFYETGEIYILKKYKSNKLVDTFQVFYQNGKLKRQEIYNQLSERTSKKCFDTLGNEIPFFEFLVEPEYPGGFEKLYELISKEMKYPDQISNSNYYVEVEIKIDKEGKVKQIKLLTDVPRSIEREINRVLKYLKQFTPAIYDGEKIEYLMNLPIQFAT